MGRSTPWSNDPDDEDGDDAEDLPDEVPVRGAGSDDDFDDLPETHLSDDDYDAFVSGEFDREGRVKGDPPVTRILLLVTAAILLAWVLFFR